MLAVPKGVTVSGEPCNNCSVAVKGYRRGTDGHKNRRHTAGARFRSKNFVTKNISFSNLTLVRNLVTIFVTKMLLRNRASGLQEVN